MRGGFRGEENEMDRSARARNFVGGNIAFRRGGGVFHDFPERDLHSKTHSFVVVAKKKNFLRFFLKKCEKTLDLISRYEYNNYAIREGESDIEA